MNDCSGIRNDFIFSVENRKRLMVERLQKVKLIPLYYVFRGHSPGLRDVSTEKIELFECFLLFSLYLQYFSILYLITRVLYVQ